MSLDINWSKKLFSKYTRSLSQTRGIKLAFIVYIVSRLFLTIWMIIVSEIIPYHSSPHEVLRPYLGVSIAKSFILGPWQRWDTLHYQAIAEYGYSAFSSSLFTPPLYPFSIRMISQLFDFSTLTSSILIGNIAYLLGLIAFYNYAYDETGDKKISKRALIYLASFPAAFFFLAGYTEPLFLLFSVLTIYTFNKQRWILSGISGGLAALTRLTGALLVIPLFFSILKNGNWKQSKLGTWSPLLGTLIGSSIFPLYIWTFLNKSPFAPILIQKGRFHGGFSIPGTNIYKVITKIFAGNAVVADYLDVTFLLFFVILLFFVLRMDISSLSKLYYLSFLFLYLIREAGSQPLLGTTRYVLILFPAFLGLGIAGKNSKINRMILYIFWPLQLFMAGQFAIWGWVG